MRQVIFISLLFLGCNLLVAQQSATTSTKSDATKADNGVPPSEPAMVAAAIRESYYHPDELSEVDCTVSFDWQALFSALKANPAADRLKTMQGMKIRSRAARDKKPEVTFDWDGGSLDNREQLEDGLKQVLGGFYQMYWSMVASSPVSNAADLTNIEPQPDGGLRVSSSSQNTKLVIFTDKERAPSHYTIESPAINGTVDLHYVPSPKPIAGDLRRISKMDFSAQIGTSTLNVGLNFDYQAVDGFYVPRHVSYDIVGAYSLSMDFSGCSASKANSTRQ